MSYPAKKIIAIIGPTASGKSDLAIALAHEYNGEIISVDSRQVYRGMDIGTGKVPRDTKEILHPDSPYLSGGIRHHLLDVADPHTEYNISHFLIDAAKARDDIAARGKLPILCGGTHFWMQALIENTALPSVSPDPVLRTSLENVPTEKLFSLLEAQDPRRAAAIDRHNRFRLIRALEIITALGTVPPPSQRSSSDSTHHESIIFVLNPETEILKHNIRERLEQRFSHGMIDEVQALHAEGLSWERLESFGLEYRYIARYLQKLITEDALHTELFTASWHYARRQLSWLRRWERHGAHLHWITTKTEAEALCQMHLIQ